jgi:iron complex outermembrane receptor protein
MRNKLMLLAMVVIMPFLAMAQYAISGKVIDGKTGEALPGARIEMENALKSTVTSQNGTFSIKQLAKGDYTLTVSYIGYETLKQKVTLDENATVNIQLLPSVFLQDEVIIQGTRANERTPMTVQNINKAELQSLNMGQDVPFLINSSPSVVTTSDAGTGIGYTGMRIRGSDMNRINITINGVPLNESETHAVYWVDLPDFASSVDNIQIQRGVGTSTNGAGAFGATINLQTNKPATEPYTELGQTFGSFNSRKSTASAGTGLINKRWVVEARASKITSDGYVDRGSANLNSIYGSASYYGVKDLFKVIAFTGHEITYQAWNGIPFDSLKTNRRYNSMGEYTDANSKIKYYNNEVDNYKQDHFQTFYSHEFNKQLVLNTALFYTKGFGYYEEYQENQSFASYGLNNILVNANSINIGGQNIPVTGNSIDATNLIRRKYLDNDFYGLVYSLVYTTPKSRLIFGGSANEYKGNNYGQVIWAQFASNSEINYEWYRSIGDKTDFNVYAKLDQKISNKLNLYIDLQYRGIDHKINGTDADLRDITQTHSFSFFNPKFGLFYDLNANNSLYASFAVAHREPSRDNFTDANPAKPLPIAEKLNDLEAGWNLKTGPVNFSTNVYYMNYDNQLVLTGQINDVGSAVMENVKSSYRLGIEFNSTIELSHMFSWKANLALSQNKINNFTEYVDNWDNGLQNVNHLGTRDLAFSPNSVAFQQLTFAPCKHFSIAFETKYVGKQYIDNTSSNDRLLHSYIVNALRTEFNFKTKYVRLVTVDLALNNLFNEKYESNAWVYRYVESGQYNKMDGYFPQAGLNLMAGVTLKF